MSGGADGDADADTDADAEAAGENFWTTGALDGEEVGGGVAVAKESVSVASVAARRLVTWATAEEMPARMLAGGRVFVALKVSAPGWADVGTAVAALARLVIWSIAEETAAVTLDGVVEFVVAVVFVYVALMALGAIGRLWSIRLLSSARAELIAAGMSFSRDGSPPL